MWPRKSESAFSKWSRSWDTVPIRWRSPSKENRTKQILYYAKDLSNNYFREMYKAMAEYAARDDPMYNEAGPSG